MAELTVGQRRSLALAAARLRLEQENPPTQQEQTWGDSLRRGSGLTKRYFVEGMTALPALVGDAANAVVNLGISGVNKATGADIKPLGSVSGLVQRGISDLPQPSEGAEQFFAAPSRALASLPTVPYLAAASGARALAPLATNLAQQAGSAIGGGFGSEIGKAVSDSPVAPVIGGLVGGAAGAYGPQALHAVARPFARAGRTLMEPYSTKGLERAAGRTANAVAGDKRYEVINALLDAKPVVPGSRPTAGQAAVPAGSTEFSALQREAEKFDPSPYWSIKGEQEAARQAHLGRVGGTPKMLEDAITARGTVTAPMREAALAGAGENIKIPTLVGKIDDIITKPGLRASDVVTKTLGHIKDKILDLKLKGRSVDTISAEDLYMIRKEIGSTIKKFAEETQNFDRKLTAGLQNNVQDFIDDAIQSSGGTGWKDYLATYSGMSRPVEQMQVGQQLQGTLRGPLGQTERPLSLANAIANGSKVVKDATGKSGEIAKILTPDQTAAVNDVVAELTRNDVMRRQAIAGGQAARSTISGTADPVPQVNFLSRPMLLLNALTKRMEGAAAEKTMAALAKEMRDPKRMAEIMAALTPEERIFIDGTLARATAQGLNAAAVNNRRE